MTDFECPKCKAEHNAVGDREEDNGLHNCDDCGFSFVVEIEYEPSYSTRCSEHEYGCIKHYESGYAVDDVYDYRVCIHCGHCLIIDE